MKYLNREVCSIRGDNEMRHLTERELELSDAIDKAREDKDEEKVKELVEELKRIRKEIDPLGFLT